MCQISYFLSRPPMRREEGTRPCCCCGAAGDVARVLLFLSAATGPPLWVCHQTTSEQRTCVSGVHDGSSGRAPPLSTARSLLTCPNGRVSIFPVRMASSSYSLLLSAVLPITWKKSRKALTHILHAWVEMCECSFKRTEYSPFLRLSLSLFLFFTIYIF